MRNNKSDIFKSIAQNRYNHFCVFGKAARTMAGQGGRWRVTACPPERPPCNGRQNRCPVFRAARFALLRVPGDRCLPAGARETSALWRGGGTPAERQTIISKRFATIPPSWICPPSQRRARGRESVSRRQTESPCQAGRPAQAGGSCRQESAGIGSRPHP